MSNVLIERVTTLLGKPPVDNPAGFIAEYELVTKPYPANVLQRAADIVCRDLGRQWPTVKQVSTACAEALEAISASNSGGKRASTARYPWELQAEQAAAWAKDWMAVHPLADQARREGWHREAENYVKSFARETLRVNQTPPLPISYRPPHDAVAYYRRNAGIRE